MGDKSVYDANYALGGNSFIDSSSEKQDSWSKDEEKQFLDLSATHGDLVKVATILGKTVEETCNRLESLEFRVKEVYTINGEKLVEISIVLPNGNKAKYEKSVNDIRRKSCAAISLWELANNYIISIKAYEVSGIYLFIVLITEAALFLSCLIIFLSGILSFFQSLG